ncbi:MAG: DUF11 domain-containing protein, partial [Lachnospiraceae bacterium]|nr:DUF11 domain-containing protein [Lachnospiraceae bacterium]
PMPSDSEVTKDNEGKVTAVTRTATVSGSDVVNGSAAIDFGTITYSAVGTYKYTVTENATTIDGVEIDSTVRNITVTVTLDETNNKLVAAVSVTGSKTFTNKYGSEGSYDGLEITKSLSGRAMEAEEFDFVITAANGNSDAAAEKLVEAGLAAKGSDSYTVTNAAAADGETDTFSILENLTFTEADAGAVYTYTVREKLPTDDDANTAGIQKDGVTYDQSAYQVVITVTDDGAGNITASEKISRLTYADGTSAQNLSDLTYPTVDSISFTNTYAATGTLDGEAYLKVAKTLIGRSGGTDEIFTFKITDAGNTAGLASNPMPTSATTTVSAPIIAGATAYGAFGDITFTKPGVYTYKITEVTGSNEISVWSQAEYTVKVTATDNGNGILNVALTSFTRTKNTYGETANVTITNNTAQFYNAYNEPDQEKTVSDAEGSDMDGQIVDIGQVLTYEVTWTNTAVDDDGNAAAAKIVITDTIPAGTKYVENSATEDGVYDASTGIITWTIENAAANATGTVSFKAEVTEDAYDNTDYALTNKASVKIGDDDPVTTNETENYVVHKDVYDATGEITGSIDGELVGLGDVLTYSIDWVNTVTDGDGNPAAATITIVDTIPDGTDYVESSAYGAVYDETERTLTWTISAAAGASGSVSFNVTVNEDAFDGDATITNDATVKVGENTYTTNETSNTVPVKTASSTGEVKVGSEVPYTITFTNTDGKNATALVTDELDDGLEYVSGSEKVTVNGTELITGTDYTFSVTEEGQKLVWNLKNLPADAKIVVSFTATVTTDSLAEIKNQADVNGHKTNYETTPVNGENDKSVYGTDESGDQIKIDGKLTGVGEELTYVIDWTNASGAEGTVTITDTIPAGTKLVDGTISNDGYYVYDEADGIITWTFEDQANGAKGSVSFTVEVTEDAVNNDGNEISNTATVKDAENEYDVTVNNYVPEKEEISGTETA